MTLKNTDARKKAGRPKGWRKENSRPARLPCICVDVELKEWVEGEAKRNRRTVSDYVRCILLEAKEKHGVAVVC